MSGKQIRRSLDLVLNPLGFEKKKSVWLRVVGSFIDVISIQSSNLDSKCTLNCGVYSDELHVELYGESPINRHPIDDADCVVRERAGFLLSGGKTDHWWPIQDESSPSLMATIANQFVLPFLNSNHSFEAMIATLEKQQTHKYTCFPNSYYLGLLYTRVGNSRDACALFYKLREKAIKLSGQNAPLKDMSDELIERYKCNLN